MTQLLFSYSLKIFYIKSPFSHSLMISWVDSIIIWSHSIIKLTPAQFKILIYFFPQTFFLPTAGQALGTSDRARAQAARSLPPPPSPLELGAGSTGSEGVREERCREKGKQSLLSWPWPVFSPCWLHVLWRQTQMGYHFLLHGTCPDAGWL